MLCSLSFFIDRRGNLWYNEAKKRVGGESDMRTSEYRLSRERFGRRVVFALVSDLHGEDPSRALALLKARRPDYILMPGDILERMDGENDVAHENGFRLLTEAARIAPVIAPRFFLHQMLTTVLIIVVPVQERPMPSKTLAK